MINIPLFKAKKTDQKELVPKEKEVSGFEYIKELISPPGAEFSVSDFRIGDTFGRSILILAYPKFLNAGWIETLLGLDAAFNISIFFEPLETHEVMKQLEKQLARIEAQIREREEMGKVRSPELETAYQDIENLRDALAQATERMFKVGFYLTIYSKSQEEIKQLSDKIVKTLASSLIMAKPIVFQQLEGYFSTLPYGKDFVDSTYQMHSSGAATFFPFISSDITSEEGVLLGVNLQTQNLIILDRFKYENPHLVIFARSGAGKSYTEKLETMRNLMMGIDVLILDPENEYASIALTYGGSFVKLSLGGEANINPFDLPPLMEGESPEDVYKEHASDLIGLLKIILGEKISPEELAVLDQAIRQTYSAFDIFPDRDFSNVRVFPTLNDFYQVLKSIEGGDRLAALLYPYVEGNFAGFINKPTNISLERRITVFGFRDLPAEVRGIGMYLVLTYIMNRVRRELKKRLVIIDEAWWIMKQESGAEFLLNAVKRGRKYLLALTTITQDVEDFLKSPYGKPIITNSAITLLMKQAPATIELVGEVFNLSEGEKKFLLTVERGQGLLIAGANRVPVYILSSYAEDQIIRTRPEQLLALRKAKELAKYGGKESK